MTAVRYMTVAVAVLVLAACQPETPSKKAADAIGPQGAASWRGESACADCSAIRTQLALQSAGGDRRYILEEVFIGARDVRFVSEGQWQQRDGIIELVGDDGARLNYAVLPDGSLQPLGIGGRRVEADDGDLLSPMHTDPATEPAP